MFLPILSTSSNYCPSMTGIKGLAGFTDMTPRFLQKTIFLELF